MRRFYLLLALSVCLAACKQEQPETVKTTAVSGELTTKDWPKKSRVNARAQELLKDWPEYKALETSFDALYTAENREDLSLILDELIEKEKELAASEYPVKFNIPQVKGRQKTFKTFALKVKGDLYYRLDTEASVLEMIHAYNAFRNQFDMIVNNTLDLKLILDE